MEGLDFRLKTQDSFNRKVESDYQVASKLNPNVTRAEIAESVNGGIRYTAVYEKNELVAAYTNTVKELEAQGYKLVKTKNTWLNDNSAYKDFAILFVCTSNALIS